MFYFSDKISRYCLDVRDMFLLRFNEAALDDGEDNSLEHLTAIDSNRDELCPRLVALSFLCHECQRNKPSE